MRRHGGEILVDTLIAHGVTHVFGMPGGQANAFYEALARRADRIRHILVRDERSAGYAADAFARISRRIGVCDATVGPGATKLPSGLMEAYNSSVPILAIISDHNRDAVLLQDRGRISQGGDQLEMLRPFAKEVFVVPSVEMLSKVVAAAIHSAVSGRPGPVVVEVPQDVFTSSCETDIVWGSGDFPKYRCVPPEEELRRAVELISRAEKPLLLVGGGARLSGAQEVIAEFYDLFSIPVVTTFSGKGCVAESGNLVLGVLGEFGVPCAKAVADAADVVLAVGYKHSQNTSYRWTWPKSGQRLIHVDIDPVELGRVFSADVPLWGDAKATLGRITSLLKDTGYRAPEEWRRFCVAEKERWLRFRADEQARMDTPIWPQAVMRLLAEEIRPGDVVIFDASFSSGWGAAYVDAPGPDCPILFPRGAAGLGYAVPAAIGAAMARPGSRILCVAGDGAFAYSVGELATLKQLGLPVTCIVLNNGVLSWAKWTQRLNFSGVNQSVELGEVNYAAVASAYGARGIRIDKFEMLPSGIREALEYEGPAVVDVVTDQWQAPNFAYREAIRKLNRGEVVNQPY